MHFCKDCFRVRFLKYKTQNLARKNFDLHFKLSKGWRFFLVRFHKKPYKVIITKYAASELPSFKDEDFFFSSRQIFPFLNLQSS